MRTTRAKVLRTRRHQRGAAMVEAAFMFPMFIILFFSLIYAHSYGATKIDEQTQARELAWTNAMSNCGVAGDSGGDQIPDKVQSLSMTRGNYVATGQTSQISMQTSLTPLSPMNGEATGGGGSSSISEAISGGSIEGALGQIVGKVVNAVSDLLPTPSGAQGVSTGSVNWRLPNNYANSDPANATTITQKVTVMCDEKPQNGSVKTVIGDIIGGIENFVSGAL